MSFVKVVPKLSSEIIYGSSFLSSLSNAVLLNDKIEQSLVKIRADLYGSKIYKTFVIYDEKFYDVLNFSLFNFISNN